MIEEYRNLINGKMIATNRWMDVVNPANEEIIGKVPSCGEEQLNEAVAAASGIQVLVKNLNRGTPRRSTRYSGHYRGEP